MKYILNENIRQILDERFILTEDASTFPAELSKLDGILLAKSGAKESGDIADDNKNINLIRQELSALNTTLSNYNKTSLNVLDKAINKLSGQVLKSSDAAKIKGTTKDVIQKVETLLASSSIANETFTPESGGAAVSVKDYLQQIKALAVSDDVSKETLLKIKENVAKITEIINNLSTTKNSDSDLIKDNVRLAENAFLSLKDLKKFISAVGGMDKFINDTEPKQQINQLITITGTIVTKYTTDGTKNLKVVEEELATFNKLVSQILELSDVKVDTDRTTTIDWADRFQKTKDKKSFWDTYYEKAWGTNANKIRALGDPFRNQCEKLGFNERTNPFITFIKKYIIEKNYPIGVNVYTAIHNAVATGKLEQTLLNSTAGDKINILACKDLYTKSASEINDYLTLFNTAYENAKLDPNNLFGLDLDTITDTTRKAQFEAVISHLDRDDKSRNQIAWMLLFDTIPFTDKALLKNDTSIKPAPYTASAVETISLRRFTEAQAIIRILAPEVMTVSNKAFDDDAVKALVAKMPRGKSNSLKIGQWILVMVGQFLSPEDEEEILRDYPELAKIAISNTDRVKLKKQILDFGNKMTKAQIIAILTAYENGDGSTEDSKVSFK